jgi:O-antigen/teichoic acid export membrane protein
LARVPLRSAARNLRTSLEAAEEARPALAELRPAATTTIRPEPAVEGTPPVTPNLVRPREIPGARRVAQNTLETLVFRGLSTPIALLLVVIQSRFLKAEGRGSFVLAVLGVTIASRLLNQLGIAVTSQAGRTTGDPRPLVQRALALAVVLGSAGAAVLIAGGFVSDEIGPRLAILASLALIPNIVWQTISGVLLGQARIRLWNVLQALTPLLTLVGMLVLVVALGGGVYAAVTAWVAANVATALVALVAAHDVWLPASRPRLLDRTARAIAGLALLMGAVQVVNLLSYRIELFILGYEGGLEDVGVYSIAMQAAESIWLVPAAIATAITGPAVHETDARAAALVGRAALRGLLLTAAVAAVVAVVAPFLIPPLLGHEFEDSALALAFLLPGVVVYAPVTILVVYLSVRRARPRLSLAVSAVGLVATSLAALLLIPAHGSAGAGAASSIGYGAGALAAWAFFFRLARRPALSPTAA